MGLKGEAVVRNSSIIGLLLCIIFFSIKMYKSGTLTMCISDSIQKIARNSR